MVDAHHGVVSAVLLLVLASEGAAVKRGGDENRKSVSRDERT